MGLVHALGAGTDAGTAWLRVVMLATAVPIAGLFVLRVARSRRAPARAARPQPVRRPAPRPVPEASRS